MCWSQLFAFLTFYNLNRKSVTNVKALYAYILSNEITPLRCKRDGKPRVNKVQFIPYFYTKLWQRFAWNLYLCHHNSSYFYFGSECNFVIFYRCDIRDRKLKTLLLQETVQCQRIKKTIV